MNNKCNHDATSQVGPDYGFTAPVTRQRRGSTYNPAAHGGIRYTEECTHCGAQRQVNANGLHREFGPWGPDAATRQRRAAEDDDSTMVNLAIGRLIRIMSRPFQPGDDEQYEMCRRIILDRVPEQPDYRPNWARDRLRGAAGD